MRLRTLRTVVGANSVVAIAGMIISAILNHIGSVIAFGSIGAIGILVMIASTTTNADSKSHASGDDSISGDELEAEVAHLVTKYAVPEEEVRGLIRRSVTLARKKS